MQNKLSVFSRGGSEYAIGRSKTKLFRSDANKVRKLRGVLFTMKHCPSCMRRKNVQCHITYLDMAVNTKKTCCLRIGPRANISCTPIQTLSGISLQWFDEIRYLGVHIMQSSCFKISLDRPKRSFYRVANSIFGRVGRVASAFQ